MYFLFLPIDGSPTISLQMKDLIKRAQKLMLIKSHQQVLLMIGQLFLVNIYVKCWYSGMLYFFVSLYDIKKCCVFAQGAASNAGEFQEVEGETAERRRARLERHQRTAERAVSVITFCFQILSMAAFLQLFVQPH